MATVERRKSHGQTVYHVKIRRKGYPPRPATFVSPGMPRPLSATLPWQNPLSRMERGLSDALQQLYTYVVWRLDKSNSDTRTNGTRWHSEDGATLGEFGVRGINVVDP